MTMKWIIAKRLPTEIVYKQDPPSGNRVTPVDNPDISPVVDVRPRAQQSRGGMAKCAWCHQFFPRGTMIKQQIIRSVIKKGIRNPVGTVVRWYCASCAKEKRVAEKSLERKGFREKRVQKRVQPASVKHAKYRSCLLDWESEAASKVSILSRLQITTFIDVERLSDLLGIELLCNMKYLERLLSILVAEGMAVQESRDGILYFRKT